MITALSWVPRGAAAKTPKKYEPTADDVERVRVAAEAENTNGAESSRTETSGLPADLNMDDYDNEDDTVDMEAEEDPYITMPGADSDDEGEDLQLKDTDAVLLAARSEDEYSSVEVYVYDEESGNLYVHHDITLSAFPLCISWVGQNPRSKAKGNLAAVGTFKPEIEVWDMDELEVLEPYIKLGGKDNSSRRSPFKSGSHHDAIMSLSWNAQQPHVLASGSADSTVKLWDMTNEKCLLTMKHHKDKVQAVEWHPFEQTVMISGAFDKTVALLDVRQAQNASSCSTESDIEMLKWNPHNPAEFAVATESGRVTIHDARNISTKLCTIQGHNKAVSSITYSEMVPGLFATASVDKTVKLWDLMGDKPNCVASKALGIGDLLCGSFYMNDPYLMAAGGSKGQVAIWETSEQAVVERTFSGRVTKVPAVNSTAPVQVFSAAEDAEKAGSESAKQSVPKQ